MIHFVLKNGFRYWRHLEYPLEKVRSFLLITTVNYTQIGHVCNCELPKATVSFVMSVRPTVCVSVSSSVRMEQLGTHWKDFHEIWYLNVFFENLPRKFKFH
jgi:hypothetical protein